MKNHKLAMFLMLVILFGMCTGAQASMNLTEEGELIYEGSITTANQLIKEGSLYTNSFSGISTEGFNDLQGQLTFSFTTPKGVKGKPAFDIFVGDPDKGIEDWFQLTDNFATRRSGKITFTLPSVILESILSDGNGNFAFGILSVKGEVLLKTTRLNVNGTAVPIPGAVWLLGSGLLGLVGFRKALHS